MTIEEFKALFLKEYTSPYMMLPVKSDGGRPQSFYNHHIYSYGALDVLINRLKNITPDSDELYEQDQLTRFSVRYIVDVDGTLWFAQEGETGGTVPAHTDMRDRCYAAGNIFFSQDYESIIKITNKSGHFKPDNSSLIWAIAALRSVDAPLASNVILELQSSVNTPINLTSDELWSLLPEGTLPESQSDFIIEVKSRENTRKFTNIKEFHSYSNKKHGRSDVEQVIFPLAKRKSLSSSSSSSSFNPAFFTQITEVAQNAWQTPPASPRRNG